MRWTMLFFVLGLLVCVGCSQSSNKASHFGVGPDTAKQSEVSNVRASVAATPPAGGEQFVILNDQGQPDPKAKPEQPRKIKYISDVKVIVEDFAKAEDGLKAALKDAKALVAHAEINSSPNTVRNGLWRIRVPIEQFDGFREALFKLGEVEKNTVDSEDLTSQYYDLEAHIKNRQAEREAVRKLLEKVGDHDIKQVIEVKRELNAITDDINRKEGQLRLWANLTDLTTVSLTLREKQKYAAPAPPASSETPTFAMRADKTWNESWESFLGFCHAIALFAIALTPWLPVALIGGGGAWLLVRRMTRAPVVVTLAEAAAGAKNS